jgi:hypothetical protein
MIITNELSIIYSSSIVDFDLFIVPENINNGFSYLNALDIDLELDLVIKPISIDTLLNNKKAIIELDENPVNMKKRKIESSTSITNKKQKIDVRKINKYQYIFTIESCGLTIRYINVKGNLLFCALDVLEDVISYKENIFREVKYRLTLDEYCIISTNTQGKPTSFITYEAITKIINIRLEKKRSSYLRNNIDKVNQMLSELKNI